MNLIGDSLLESHRQECAKLGLHDYRSRCVESLKLKTVIKESHGSPVSALLFNRIDPECTNIFGTTGKDQVTVYDDQHSGESVAVMLHFVNEQAAHAPGGELGVCAWLNSEGWLDHPRGDACLAVSGEDPTISVISVVDCQVSYQLKGHKKEVICLDSCAARPRLLASLSRDGDVRIWDVPAENCIAQTSASGVQSLAFHPDGGSILTGSNRGALHAYTLPIPSGGQEPSKAAKRKRDSPPALALQKQAAEVGESRSHSEAVHCLRFLDAFRVASLSTDGRLVVTSVHGNKQIASWRVPACTPSSRCSFGTTSDGAFLCAGNSKGEAFVYETASGTLLKRVTPPKVNNPVLACGLSEDCRHLLVATGNAFIFRFEAPPSVLELEAANDTEASREESPQ